MYGSPRNDGGDYGPKPPVSVGEVLEVTIEAVGAQGDGIAKKNGFVLFVPGAKEGQKVKIKISKVLRKVGFAEVVGEGTAVTAKSSEGPAEQSSEAPQEEEAPEPAEDSENFGEETPAEEVPAEEAPEEEAAEEPEE